MKRELLRRLNAISERNREQPRYMTRAERAAQCEAELDAIGADLERDAAELRAKLGEEAYAQHLAECKRETEQRLARAALIEIKPEWNVPGFDVTTLTMDELDAVLLQFEREMFPEQIDEEQRCWE